MRASSARCRSCAGAAQVRQRIRRPVNATENRKGPARVQVVIEAEAGSNVRHAYDGATLEPLGSREVAVRYPFPYGFVVGTTTDDGDAIDCYLLTADGVSAGTVVEADLVGVLEQFEKGARSQGPRPLARYPAAPRPERARDVRDLHARAVPALSRGKRSGWTNPRNR
jgi:hypothetical protein